MHKFLVILGLLVSLNAYGEDTKVPRLSVKIILTSVGKPCDTYASTMQDEHFVCVHNDWKLRTYRVTYKFHGELKTSDVLFYPPIKIRVNESGDIIAPNNAMYGHY